MTAPLDDRLRPRSRISYELPVPRFVQPDDVTCGPTCLLKVYDFYGLPLELETVVGEIERNEDGGTLAVYLANAAMERGFCARIFSYDLRIFDPTWRGLEMSELQRKIAARIPHLRLSKAIRSAEAYLGFLELGGEVAFDELNPRLLKSIVDRNHPVLAGLSGTYLYGMPRERQDRGTHDLVEDDVAGDAVGHFVVVSGYERWGRQFVVLDPSAHIPRTDDGRLVVDAQRLINAILLGDLTYDAVLLELWMAGDA